jgi:hypothetical protein
MINSNRKCSILVMVSVSIAWLIAAGPMVLLRHGLPLRELRPNLPLVSLPFDSHRDVVSSVPHLFITLVFCLIAMTSLEPAKIYVARNFATPFAAYVIFSLQLTLGLDILRAYAYDWWCWMISWIGWERLHEAVDLREVSGIRFPWVSTGAAILVLAYMGAAARRRDIAPSR